METEIKQFILGVPIVQTKKEVMQAAKFKVDSDRELEDKVRILKMSHTIEDREESAIRQVEISK